MLVTKKLIIDTDCGIDDAIAILMALADPAVEVIGITCVSGNVPLDLVTRNVAIVLDAVGAGAVPIFRGADRPLLGAAVHASSVHGQDGLGDAGFPTSTRRVEPESAVLGLVRLARDNPGAALIPLGPLTNVALALVIEPELPRLLGETVLMGGAVQAIGNTTPVAEFNIYADAEAAAIVFERGLNPTVLTWEATLETPIVWAEWDRLLAAGPIGSRFVAPMTAAQSNRAHERQRPGILMPDPLAMAALLDKDCATTYSAVVDVDTSHGIARGLTALDRSGMTGRPHNAKIVSKVDPARFGLLIERAFRMECRL
jgi:purine nucleosidase